MGLVGILPPMEMSQGRGPWCGRREAALWRNIPLQSQDSPTPTPCTFALDTGTQQTPALSLICMSVHLAGAFLGNRASRVVSGAGLVDSDRGLPGQTAGAASSRVLQLYVSKYL